MIAVMNWLLPILYLALLLDYSATFFLQRRTRGWSAWLPVVVVAHAALVGLRAAETGRAPPTNAQEVLSVVALTTAAVYVLVELASRDRRTGLFVLLLVFLFQYTSSILLAGAGAESGIPAAAGRSVRSGLHVTAALVTYTALGFAAVYGALHLAAQRDLQRRRFGVLFDRLPPVERLGRMSWHAMAVGFVFLTATIAAAPLSHGAAGATMTPKITSKIIAGSAAWGIYAAAILGRWIGRWPATRISAIAILGFVVVIVLMGASGLLS